MQRHLSPHPIGEVVCYPPFEGVRVAHLPFVSYEGLRLLFIPAKMKNRQILLRHSSPTLLECFRADVFPRAINPAT